MIRKPSLMSDDRVLFRSKKKTFISGAILCVLCCALVIVAAALVL